MRKVKSAENKYTIIHTDSLPIHVNVIEEEYSAKYVGEFCYKQPTKGWLNQSMALFYTDTPHPEGSNYLGVVVQYNPYTEENSIIIVNGISAVEHEWIGVLDIKTDEILYSAFRHDYQTHGDLMADGGPEYTRSSLHLTVKMQIVKDKIVILKDNIIEIENDTLCK